MSKEVKIQLLINENKNLEAKVLDSSELETKQENKEEQTKTNEPADIECTFISPVSLLFFLKCYFKQQKNISSDSTDEQKAKDIFLASVSKTHHAMKNQNYPVPSEDDALSAPIVSCSDYLRFFDSIISAFPEIESQVVDPMEDYVVTRARDSAIIERFVELMNQSFSHQKDENESTKTTTIIAMFRVNIDEIESIYDINELQEGISKLSHGFDGMITPAIDETVLHLTEIVKSQQMLLENIRAQNQDIQDVELMKELETKFDKLPSYIKRTRQLQRDIKSINDRVEKMKRRSHKAHVNRDKQATRNASRV